MGSFASASAWWCAAMSTGDWLPVIQRIGDRVSERGLGAESPNRPRRPAPPDLHALREAVHTRSLNSADVDEHVLASLIRLDKPVALCLVEPLHRASSHVESPLRLLGTGSMSAARRDYSELKSRSSALYFVTGLRGTSGGFIMRPSTGVSRGLAWAKPKR